MEIRGENSVRLLREQKAHSTPIQAEVGPHALVGGSALRGENWVLRGIWKSSACSASSAYGRGGTHSSTRSKLLYAPHPKRRRSDHRRLEGCEAQTGMNVTTKLLTIPRSARAMGLNHWLAWHLVNWCSIPSVVVGTRRRIDAGWIEQWLAAGGYYPPERESGIQDISPRRRQSIKESR